MECGYCGIKISIPISRYTLDQFSRTMHFPLRLLGTFHSLPWHSHQDSRLKHSNSLETSLSQADVGEYMNASESLW